MDIKKGRLWASLFVNYDEILSTHAAATTNHHLLAVRGHGHHYVHFITAKFAELSRRLSFLTSGDVGLGLLDIRH